MSIESEVRGLLAESRRIDELGEGPAPLGRVPTSDVTEVRLSVGRGSYSQSAFVACAYCETVLVLIEGTLKLISQLAGTRGWTCDRGRAGWICPGCRG